MPVVDLPSGPVHYSEQGSGRPVLCLHGYLMGEELFAPLAERLAHAGLRCITPTFPLGAHRFPMSPEADLTPYGLARIVADFCEALDLDDVVLIGNDTGGALCQVVATRHPDRIGAMVLTNCDAFDNFPPSFFRLLVPLAAVPGALTALLQGLRFRALRRSPVGYGLLSHHQIDDLTARWVRPVLERSAVRRDLRKVTRALRSAVTEEAARELPRFDRPTLLAWSGDDRLFPLKHAQRLAALLSDARLEIIEESRTFSMIDQPDVLASLIVEMAATPQHGPAAGCTGQA